MHDDTIANWRTLVIALLVGVSFSLPLWIYEPLVLCATAALVRNALRQRFDAWVSWIIAVWAAALILWLLLWADFV